MRDLCPSAKATNQQCESRTLSSNENIPSTSHQPTARFRKYPPPPIRKSTRIIKKKSSKPVIWKKSSYFAGAVSLPQTSRTMNDSQTFPTDSSFIDYFYEFFTDDLLDLIAGQSNLYSVQETGVSARFTKEDIKDFLAWELLTGVVVMPSYLDYYSRSLRYEKVASIMPLKKLQKIRRFIHFADNSEMNNDRFFKVRPLIEEIRQKCLSIEEEDKFSIDEMMIAYKGKKAGTLRQFMKDKPIRWGFKFFVRAGISGMIYDFFPFSGADTLVNFKFSKKEMETFSFSSFCVLALCQTMKSPALKGVYFDIFFSCPELVSHLRREYGILSLGTLRANRSHGADKVLKTEKQLKAEGRGSFDQVTDSENKIAVVKWYDNKPVLLISSYVGIGTAKTIQRYNRSTKMKENINCPECISEYNAFMGGVDLSDMLLSLYKTHFKSRRWYTNIFAQMIDISINNAWILYKRDHPANKITLKDFRVQVAEEILLYRRPYKRRLGSRSPTPPNPRQPTISIQDTLRYDQVGHIPYFGTKGRCRNCQVGQTTVQCRKCKAVKKFVEAVSRTRKKRACGGLSWRTAVKFLCARKWDVSRAVALYDQHEITRIREGLVDLDPDKEPLKSELDTGKFTILPTRDSTGAAIAVFTARIHCPQTSTHQTTLQGLVYQLDVALESVETQKAGIVFIYDMSDSKYSHFDYDLSQKILTLLKGGYPAKLKKVLIVTAPLWFKAPFKILRLFVREKLRDRVFTVSLPQLSVHIPRESLPVGLGGALQVAHHAWLLHCAKSMANRASPSRLSAISTIENEVESPAISEAEEVQPQESWQPTTESAASPLALSSASSGFSDDDSLHCDSPGGLTLAEFIERVRSLEKSGLTLEYTELKARPPQGTFNHSKLKANQVKNRYTDVLCYDHSRVLLSIEDDDPSSDYINANFVDGYKQKNAFISTQGPLPKTCGDFWRMVWEQGTVVVVMTTRVMERGRQKCWQYWPLEEGSSQTYGRFTLTTVSVDTQPDYVVSVLDLVNTQTEEKRTVEHLQYTSWPDYGVPESAGGMLGFLQLVRSTQERLTSGLGDTWAGHSRGPPVVVHCSAGIGRTGTFCTLDICISRLDETGTVDVRGTVERIRSQRAFSIQMPDQYIFCHVALIEYAVSKGLAPPVDLSHFLADRDSD